MMGQQMVNNMQAQQPMQQQPMQQQPVPAQPVQSVAPAGEEAAPKFCPNCGTPTNGAKFCSNCGNKLV